MKNSASTNEAIDAVVKQAVIAERQACMDIAATVSNAFEDSPNMTPVGRWRAGCMKVREEISKRNAVHSS